jgi:hypothetical protein
LLCYATLCLPLGITHYFAWADGAFRYFACTVFRPPLLCAIRLLFLPAWSCFILVLRHWFSCTKIPPICGSDSPALFVLSRVAACVHFCILGAGSWVLGIRTHVLPLTILFHPILSCSLWSLGLFPPSPGQSADAGTCKHVLVPSRHVTPGTLAACQYGICARACKGRRGLDVFRV